MMSRAERPSKNSNAANHHMVPLTSAAQLSACFRQSLPTICPLLYDTMMMVVGESSEKKGAAKAQAGLLSCNRHSSRIKYVLAQS